MSSKHKIFGYVQRGIDTIQGRNAQIPMSMTKRYEADNGNPSSQREQIISPFMGYNASQTNLTHSQVSQVNTQLFRRIAKEQIERYSKQSGNKNQYGVVRTQIRSMKQLVFELQQRVGNQDRQNQLLKDQLSDYVRKISKDSQQESLKCLRQVFAKTNENIKKQTMNKISRQFLERSFAQQVESQTNELFDRIDAIENKIKRNLNQRPPQDPVLLAQTIDLRLKKMQRQMQSVKKSHSELLTNVREQMEPTVEKLKKKIQNNEQNRIQDERKIVRQRQQVQKQIKKISTNIDELRNQNITLAAKMQNLRQELSQRINKSSLDVKDFIMNSENMTTSGLLEHHQSSESRQQKSIMVAANTSYISNQSVQKNGQISPDKKQRQSFKSPQSKQIYTSPTKQFSNTKISVSSPSSTLNKQNSPQNSTKKSEPQTSDKQQQPNQVQPKKKQIEYRIDSQNRLLDENNSYILDENGRVVTLSTDQVQLLRKSDLVKLQE